MNEDKVTISFGDGDKIEMKCGFIGGIMADFTEAPFGMYAGKLDIEKMSFALLSLNRAVIKLAQDDMNMTLKQAQVFLDFCVKEAIEKERANRDSDNVTLGQHEMFLKKKKNTK